MSSSLSAAEQSRLDTLLSQIRDGSKVISASQRAAIVGIAESSNPNTRPNLITDPIFQGSEFINYQDREDAFILGRALGAGLRDFFAGSSDTTLADAIPGAANLGGFDSGGPADISGYIVTVPFEREPSKGRKSIGKVRVNVEWDDTLEEVRQKARDAIRGIIGATDMRFRLMF